VAVAGLAALLTVGIACGPAQSVGISSPSRPTEPGVLAAAAQGAARGGPPTGAQAGGPAHGASARGPVDGAPAAAGRGAGPSGGLLEATWARPPLLTEAVVLDEAGRPVPVAPGRGGASDPAAQRAQDLWLASGRVPGPERYRDMARQALRDLDALVLDDGSALAGLADPWAYVWPRDASFVAVALERSGHHAEAVRVLARLAELHASSVDGVFEARYDPATDAAPDGRARQLDGCGWALWAAGAVCGDGGCARVDLEPVVRGCLAAIDAQTGPDGLPGAWSDYWEVPEDTPTLGTVAALAAGVEAVGPVVEATGDADLAALVADLRGRLGRGVESFAPGYGRHGPGDACDTSVAFLMPPFADPDADVARAWRAAGPAMTRPAGGLAPGEAWRADGISWTPTTAMFAYTAAAAGDRERAERWLDWLDEHRTARGSLPEKVLGDGSPASVAPLAWTSALVVLTLDELDRR
jgi:hypothetical protein